MKDTAVAAVMDAFVEPADDAAADWDDVLSRAETEPAEVESTATARSHPARNGSHGSPVPERRPRWRGRTSRVTLVVLALAGAAVAAALLRDGRATERQPIAGTTTVREVPTTGREIQRRTQSALVDTRELIVHSTHTTQSGQFLEVWEDLRQNRQRMNQHAYGTLANARLLENLPGEVRLTIVDYNTRTWRSKTTKLPPGTGPLGSSGNAAEQLQEQLSRGDLKLVGAEQLEGRDTLHLRRTSPARIDIWVDADSYLPVREQFTGAFNRTPQTSVTEYEWLPRTDENVEKTKLTVPPGFLEQTAGSSFGAHGIIVRPSKR